MIEGNTPAEIKLAETAGELAQIEYELSLLLNRVAELRTAVER